jgi:hypothetical protein
MSERSDILDAYRRWMTERWGDALITFDEVRALKVFCEVHRLTADEHETIADEVGIDQRELMDDNNQRFVDWLRMRRQSLPLGSGALRFALPEDNPPWKLRLPEPPPTWQNVVAGVAAVVVVASLIVLFVVS